MLSQVSGNVSQAQSDACVGAYHGLQCTSACSVDVEEKLYTEAVGMGIACITLSQRLALEDFHTQELRMGANNERGYEICKISRDHGSFDPRTAGAGLQCTPDLKLTSPLQVGGTL